MAAGGILCPQREPILNVEAPVHLHLGRVLVKAVVVPTLDSLSGTEWQHPMLTFASLVFDCLPDMYGG